MSTLGAIAQVLVFLGTVSMVLVAIAATIGFLLAGRPRWARASTAAGAATIVLYALVLVATSVASDDRVLAASEAKLFCEIDCHVAYDVLEADRAPNRSGDMSTLRVTVRESFDARSISPRRGDSPLSPGERRFHVVTADGRRFPPTAIRALDSLPLFSPLRPGQAHHAELVFDVPVAADIKGLLVEDDALVSPLLIGHERAPFHGKVLLSLGVDDRRQLAGAKDSAPQ